MGFFFSKPSYNPDRDIPDLTGKVAIVTGANNHTTEHLALHGAKVYLACHTESKARDAITGIERAHLALKDSGRLVWLPLDLASLRRTKLAAELFLTLENRLDLLLNNAGRLPEKYVLTEDGIKQSVAVNHVGHFVFTDTLLPLLKQTAHLPDTDVASNGYKMGGTVTRFESLADFNDAQAAPGKENGLTRKLVAHFGTTKLMNILNTAELQRRLDEDGEPITAIALHPGAHHRPLPRSIDNSVGAMPWPLPLLLRRVTLTPLQGASTSLFAATSPRVAAERGAYKGAYIKPYGVVTPLTRKEARDPVLARTLCRTTEAVYMEAIIGHE
ncbi:NAD(P)-binding protein [Auriscalpium vulgare]|uniref:NAD(P)-binding protein n=1 Tax=Auriscalpium vulgare TaxID=40419 RepID=A0ACB8RT44_9AGAM|nr:NAD(P)-binding protein [Auriscalpium vulgare]